MSEEKQEQIQRSYKEEHRVTFYNGGDRINEKLMFSIPGDYDPHCIGYHVLFAEKQSLFKVPTRLVLAAGAVVPVDFPTTVKLKFGGRGVVMIDADHTPLENDEARELKNPIAATVEAAREKGAKLWQNYCYDLCMKHIEFCEKVRQKGGMPPMAEGFLKKCFNELGLRDPGQVAMDTYRIPQTDASNPRPGQRGAVSVGKLTSEPTIPLSDVQRMIDEGIEKALANKKEVKAEDVTPTTVGGKKK